MTLTRYKSGVNVYLQSTCKILINFTLHCHLELLKALETCMKNPTAKPYMLEMVYDKKSWISDYCEELHEHTEKHLCTTEIELWAMERAYCNAKG